MASASRISAAIAATGRAIERYAIRMSGCSPRNAETVTVPRIANSRLTAKVSRVPMNVSAKMRAGMPIQGGSRRDLKGIRVFECSSTAFIQHGEFEAGIGRKQLRNFAQTLGQSRRGEQWVIALAQIVIVDVEVQRQQIN